MSLKELRAGDMEQLAAQTREGQEARSFLAALEAKGLAGELGALDIVEDPYDGLRVYPQDRGGEPLYSTDNEIADIAYEWKGFYLGYGDRTLTMEEIRAIAARPGLRFFVEEGA